MSKKILVTAFEPFGGLELNSSALVLEKLKQKYKNIEVMKLQLPVLYKEAYDILEKTIEELSPDVVICMGQAGGRKKISIERIAVNINNSLSKDNSGITKIDDTIKNNGPSAYFTNLPYKQMLSASGNAVVMSYSAGTYICNDIFYRLMDYIITDNPGIKGGFLHLPYTEHFGKMPYTDLESQVSAVESMLAALGEINEK